MDIYEALSPYAIMERASVKRFQVFLDTGYYPEGQWSKTWDMLAWVEAQNKSAE